MSKEGNSETLVLLSKAILELQNDVKALHTLFLDNVTFIKGMGDVPEKMGEILFNIVEEHDKSVQHSYETMLRSSEFFKNTQSQIYPKMNIMQEWFSEFNKEIVHIFTGLELDYIQQWMIVRTQDFVRPLGKLSGEMNYEERVEFGERMIRAVTQELGADPLCAYIMRTLFIPYISIYYLRPLTDYPYFKEWKAELEQYKMVTEVREEMREENGTWESYNTEFLNRLKARTFTQKI